MAEIRARRIALLGGESSGKTTLAQALAVALDTRWVPEYGRQRWEELRLTLSLAELVEVARTQIAWEDEQAIAAAAAGGRWIVCDTTPLTTLQYALHDHGQAPEPLHAMATRGYEMTVLCEPEFAFVQDGCRRDDGFRRAQHDWTLQQLASRGVKPLLVRGTVAERVQKVLHALPAAAAAVSALAAGSPQARGCPTPPTARSTAEPGP